jgi:hypothetical protein
MMRFGSGVKQILGRLFPRWRDFRRSRASYRAHFGHSPRFLFAKTFNEKVQRYKILNRDPRMPLRADKVLVKDFVTEKLGPGWTTPTLWHGARRCRPCTKGFGHYLSCSKPITAAA